VTIPSEPADLPFRRAFVRRSSPVGPATFRRFFRSSVSRATRTPMAGLGRLLATLGSSWRPSLSDLPTCEGSRYLPLLKQAMVTVPFAS